MQNLGPTLWEREMSVGNEVEGRLWSRVVTGSKLRAKMSRCEKTSLLKASGLSLNQKKAVSVLRE